MTRRWTQGAGRRRLWALGVALTVVLPLFAGWFPQEPLRRRAEAALQSAFPGAQIGRLRVVPGLLSAEVDDLHLPGTGFVLDVPGIRAGFSPPPLSGGAPALRYLHVSAPELSVEASGPSKETPPTRLPFPLRIAELTIQGGRLRLQPVDGAPMVLDGLDVSGSIGTGELDLRADRLDLGDGKSAGPLEARVAISPDLQLRLLRFEGQVGAGSRITAEGTIGDAFDPAPVLRGSLSLDLADASPYGLTGASGRATGELELDARVEPWRGRLSLQGARLHAAGWPVDTLSLAGEGSVGDAQLVAKVETLDGRAEGRARLRDGRLEARLELRQLEIGQLATQLAAATPAAGGRLSGELLAQGPLDGKLSVEGQLRLASPSVETLVVSGRGALLPETPAMDIDWRATLAAGATLPGAPEWLRHVRVQLDGTARGELPPELRASLAARLEADLPAGAVEAELGGSLRNRGTSGDARLEAQLAGGSLQIGVSAREAELEELSLAARDVDLASLVPEVGGDLALELSATGPENALAAEATVGVSELRVRDRELGRLDARLLHSRGTSRLVVQLPALGATAQLEGSAPFPRVEGELAVDSMPLETLASLLAPDAAISGRLSGGASFSVPRDDPAAASARLDLRDLEIALGAHQLKLVRPGELSLAAGRVSARGLAVEIPGLTVGIEGEAGLAVEEPISAEVELRAQLGELSLPEGWTVTGDLAGSAHLTGTALAPSPVGWVELGPIDARIPGLPHVSSGPARLTLDGDVASVDQLRAEVAGGWVTVSGQVSLASLFHEDRPPGTSALSVRWTDLDAAQLLAGPDASAPLAARLTGEATLRGDLADLAQIEVDVRGEAAEVDVQGLSVSLSPYRLRLEGGRVLIEELAMTARGERFSLSGNVGIADRSLDLRARGALALRTLNPFLPEAAASGRADVDVSLTGSWDAPEARGRLALSEGTLRLRTLNQPLTEVRGDVFLDGTLVRLEDVRGLLGGGEIRLDGSALVAGRALDAVHVEAHGEGMALQYPEGFKSRTDADLILAGSGDALELTGNVVIQRGLYDVDIALQESLFAEVVEPEESPLLRAIGLDVDVQIDNPILVRNNLARLEARGRLTARGNLDRPAPYGRLEILPGGKIFLQTREFVVETGSLAYSGDFDPQVSVTASTRIEAVQELADNAAGDRVQFDVTIEARGSLESPRLTFSSTPPASEPELISIIATGRTRNQALSQGSRIAAGQVAAFLAGRVTSDLSRTLEEFGLDEVSIQPQLLAREQDPTARFTFGKRVTDYANLIYSVGLGGPEERFVRLEVSPFWDISAAVQRDDAGLFTYGLGQRLRWGGPPRPKAQTREEQRVRLDGVRLEGELPLPEAALRAELRSASGTRSTAWEVQDDAERLRDHLVDLGYIEAQVGARLEERTAVFHVRSGPRYSWRVEGYPESPNLDATIRRAFHEEEALELGRERLIRALRRAGHLRAAVTTRSEATETGRVLVFDVEAGALLQVASLEFPGAKALSRSALERAAGGAAELLVAPEAATGRIAAAYQQAHYYAAKVSAPEVSEQAGAVSIRVPVVEGPRATIARVEVRGAPEADAPPAVGLEPGTTFSPDAAAAAAARLREHYLSRGYPGVDVTVRLSPEGPDVVVGLAVDARERVVIGAIDLVGLRRSKESLVRRQLTFAVGDPLDPRELVRSEARLLALGVFSRASITAEDNPAVVRVSIVELPKFTAAYDLRYDEEERFVGLVESEAGNLLGSGLTVGARARAGQDLRELRGSLFLPSLWAGGDLTISAFRREEDELAVPDQPDFGQRQQFENGIRLQQNLRLGNRWNVLYGYGFSRIQDETPFFPDPLVTRLASLDVGVFRDSRDNALDPTRGRFYALDLRLAQDFLGSDTHFVKGFAQAFFHRKLTDSLLWAHGYRLGLAHGFGGRPIVGDERFEAGGANSVRGFETNSLGPRDAILNQPLGGEAVLVVNQELRYRHASGLGAVVFWDAGDVFAGVADVDLDLRHALGVGFRYRSPVGLVRVDWAFPLARRENESRSRFHFSIGQAF